MTPHSLPTSVTLLTLLALVGIAVWLRNAYEATERRWIRILCLVLLAVDFVAFQIIFFYLGSWSFSW